MRKSKKKQRSFLFILSSILFLTCLVSTTVFFAKDKASSQVLIAHNHELIKSEHKFKPFTTSMTLAAVGDILIHGTVYKDAKTPSGYDFRPMLSSVKDLMGAADLTVANQETIVGGTEIGLSTYPSFNSPFEVADAVQDSGVDIVTMANNHTLDRGERAILSATSYLSKIGLEYTGGFRSIEDRNRIRVLNRNGIRIAFLSYTYGTNGIPVPQGKDYLVNLIDLEKIKTDVAKAKELSDVVAVSMHWGTEYQRLPSDQQKELAQELADIGVNLIIGHHPHVLQPMAWLKGKNGNDTFVIYSLGNFLSGQTGNYKDIGGVLQIKIVKETKSNNETTITLQNPVFTPTYVANQHLRNFKVVPLLNASAVGLANSNAKYEEINQHMNQWIEKNK